VSPGTAARAAESFSQAPPVLGDRWAGDRALREALAFALGAERFALAEPALARLGEEAGSPETLALAARAEREGPRHVAYAPWGERRDELSDSPAFSALYRWGLEHGVTALPYEDGPFGDAARLAWAGAVLLWGPSSAIASCPAAMSDGAARVLLDAGDGEDAAVAARLVSRDPDVAWTSGQWMTERAGGSDVGGTETVAIRDGGAWRLHGTKWFASAATSDLALALARPEGAPPGSRGLTLFRVHRLLPDGSRNAIELRRLKDKLGTRAMPTAELELRGALARPVGPPQDGVRRIAAMLGVTRLHNVLAAAGLLGRGLAWARANAAVRSASGALLRDLPAHRATLADLAVDHAAALALGLRLAELQGRAEHGAGDDQRALLRLLTPVAKLATARWAIAGTAEAMEALGGVGYCEDSMRLAGTRPCAGISRNQATYACADADISAISAVARVPMRYLSRVPDPEPAPSVAQRDNADPFFWPRVRRLRSHAGHRTGLRRPRIGTARRSPPSSYLRAVLRVPEVPAKVPACRRHGARRASDSERTRMRICAPLHKR
jgi:alkylation response protein AidB-like acyl-CoA dehydrogenase